MRAKKLFLIFGALLVAFVLTAAVYRWDKARAHSQQIAESIHWAKQVVAQAELLSINAQTYESAKSIPDPKDWALGFLNHGDESRVMKISKFARAPGFPRSPGFKELESHRIDPVTGVFEYARVDRVKGEGFRVQLLLGHRGFLGARSQFGNDLSLVVVFLLFGAPAYMVLRWGFQWFGVRHGGELESQRAPNWAPLWSDEVLESLGELGVSLDRTVQDAQVLYEGNKQNKELLLPIQLRVKRVLGVLQKLQGNVNAAKHPQMAQIIAKLQQVLLPLENEMDIAVNENSNAAPVARKLHDHIAVLCSNMATHVRLLQRLKSKDTEMSQDRNSSQAA